MTTKSVDHEVAKGNTSLRRVRVTFYCDWETFLQLAKDERIKYITGQEEVCPTTGRDHIQAYIEFKNALKFRTIKKILPNNANFDKAYADPETNRHYCGKPWPDCKCDFCTKPGGRKPGGRSLESGEISKGQGSRTDLIKLKRALEEGAKEADLISSDELFPVWCRYPNIYKRYKCAKITGRDRNTKPEVSFITGASGVGKTRRVFDEHKDNVYMKDNSKWWDGYEGQRCILLDELDTHEHWKIEEMLRLLDRYPYQGQTKGGYININSPYITITSNKSLDELYPEIGEEQMNALLRRIDYQIKL